MAAVETKTITDHYRAAFKRTPAVAQHAWLTPIREAALSRFVELGFPTTRHEDWRFTSIAPLAEIEFQAPGDSGPSVKSDDLADITKWDAGCSRLVFVNGRFAAGLSSIEALPAGVKVTNLAQAMVNDRPVVEAHLTRHAEFQDEAFTAMNTAFFSDGAFIHLGKGAVVQQPIHLLFVATTDADPIVTHPRNLIVAETGSQATIVESYYGLTDRAYLTNAVTEIVAADNAVLDHYKVQRESVVGFHKGALHVHLHRTSNVSSNVVNLGGRIVRNDMNALLDGEGGECTFNGLTVLGGRQHCDNHLRVNHAKPHCNSWEFFKGIYDDRARGVFTGRIFVAEDAQKTDAKQSNMSLLLSDHALVDSKPQLEIFADDVKCTHGVSIGQIDEEALFYLQSRGLSREAARSLLIYAFAGESIGQIRVEPLRDQLSDMLFQRLPRGELLRFGRPYEYSRDFGRIVRETDRHRET